MNQGFLGTGSESIGALSTKSPEILAVSDLLRRVTSALERQFPLLRVRGEISNLSLASSGHVYFSLKDRQAQMRCVMFRAKAHNLAFRPKEGDLVDVLAQLSVYEPRGDLQLQIEQMRPAGQGDLQLQFLRLKQKLQAEGLFDQARKRTPAALPKAIGVITSLQAAALRDVLATLAQRMPSMPVVIYPASVQGVGAPQSLIEALRLANARCECDVLLLVRGGGSIEDLWAFNDEALARSIAASELPVIAGIGHESDVTIADFAADLRAPTPTAAAMEACPTRQSLERQCQQLAQAMALAWQACLRRFEQQIDYLSRRIKAPSQRLQDRAEALRRLSLRLRPPGLDRLVQRLDAQSQALRLALEKAMRSRENTLANFASQLSLLSPERVLERGYALVLNDEGHVVSDASALKAGDLLDLRLAKGAVEVLVQARHGVLEGQ
ncbi:MAG: exodeoxyribonuclease VII large subunit [Betaproteobacteria bacterium]|nr:exodeoxyribonuclease VII large subunit [Betaproteobacteria bacterium]HAB46794.1 exodeoxyribonuclease VII large subunit [Lautropia sp.]NBQ96060.1 exodeoxyribonuclease VII large subunit [Betaproteobacteria bacterium]NBT71812.1 exodeoxyribonuclease VII large subunit [Betaproteobacteria bacterium]NBT82426.1 exodeoxyribonuclease VII large subunit [Betaproteobacteria bacterium]